MPEMKKDNKSKQKNNLAKSLFITFGILLGILYLYNLFSIGLGPPPEEVKYSAFYIMVKDNPTTQKIKKLEKTDGLLQGEFSDNSFTLLPDEIQTVTFHGEGRIQPLQLMEALTVQHLQGSYAWESNA